MKYTLHTLPINGGPFNCAPASSFSLELKDILANNVILLDEFNPHSCSLWVIGNEFGPIVALWADHAQEAFDVMVDEGFGDSFLISEEDQAITPEDEREEWAHLGNAGEPCDLSGAWIRKVSLKGERDFALMMALAEARGNGSSTLDF